MSAPRMTDGEIATIEARASAATAGPWRHDLDIYDPDQPEFCASVWDEKISILFTNGTDILNDLGDPTCGPRAQAHQSMRDAEFMAHAREDVPALIAALRSARESEARLASLCLRILGAWVRQADGEDGGDAQRDQIAAFRREHDAARGIGEFAR